MKLSINVTAGEEAGECDGGNEMSLVYNFQCYLLRDFSEVFKKSLEKNMKYTRLRYDYSFDSATSTAQITFNLSDIMNGKPEKSEEGKVGVQIPSHLLGALSKSVKEFTDSGIRTRKSNTEFIPLKGDNYTFEDMKKDIRDAVQGKRDLCILKTTGALERLNRNIGENNKFSYQIIKHGSDLYSNVAIAIANGNQEEFKDLICLQKDWFI